MRQLTIAACGLWSSLALGAQGCAGGERVNIGDTAVLGAQLSDYAGSWSGYAEAFTFNDNSDAVRLKLDAGGNGVLEVGEAPALSAPDPDQPFPGSSGDPQKPTPPLIVSGFSYPVYDADVEVQRLRVRARSSDVYQAWCALQTPQLVPELSPETYACLPTISFVSVATGGNSGCFIDDQLTKPVDCDRAACLFECECTAQHCDAHDQSKGIQLDGVLSNEGEQLTGTLVVGGDRITVHLSRS